VDKTGNFLVVGAGLAGLSFALRAAAHTKVTILAKTDLMDSNSSLAQGGIAAVQRLPDNYFKHVSDTIHVGQGLSDRKAVELMVHYGPTEISWLIEQGVDFSYYQGELDLTREGGHSARRVVHAGDITGYNVQDTLTLNARAHPNIQIIENTVAIDLLVEQNRCMGVSIITPTGAIAEIRADTTVLCTGGSGQVFAKTSNPVIATGDGVAMAYRAGVVVRDMEFYQFHPSILDHGESPYFLVSEAVRGEGGILVNSQGEHFMPRYHSLHDLAPRDVVSRAIVSEQKTGQVYIDIRERGEHYLSTRFAGIYKECEKRGFKMDEDLLPVSPAAHYMCGGIKVSQRGETSLKGLLAFGETSCSGVHGANRLASNSTLECMTFTHYATENLDSSDSDFPTVSPFSGADEGICHQSRRAFVQDLMWESFGIVRNQDSMGRSEALLKVIEQEIISDFKAHKSRELIEEMNIATVGLLLAKTARIRNESRGTHKIEETPFRDDQNWLKHIEIKKNKVTLVDH
jgi:L-aspartate oxidase